MLDPEINYCFYLFINGKSTNLEFKNIYMCYQNMKTISAN